MKVKNIIRKMDEQTVDWNECDLVLTDQNINNIFVEVLKLV